jgi:hypothetical protein
MDLDALGEQMAARKAELESVISDIPAGARRGKNGIPGRANTMTR